MALTHRKYSGRYPGDYGSWYYENTFGDPTLLFAVAPSDITRLFWLAKKVDWSVSATWSLHQAGLPLYHNVGSANGSGSGEASDYMNLLPQQRVSVTPFLVPGASGFGGAVLPTPVTGVITDASGHATPYVFADGLVQMNFPAPMLRITRSQNFVLSNGGNDYLKRSMFSDFGNTGAPSFTSGVHGYDVVGSVDIQLSGRSVGTPLQVLTQNGPLDVGSSASFAVILNFTDLWTP